MDNQKRVAYFVPEVAIHPSLETYAGGLGYLAGSYFLAAARQKFPAVGVTILWRQGYYDQRIGPNGMEIDYREHNYEAILEDTGVRVKVQIGGNPNVWLKVWLLKPEIFGTVPIYFLDADIEENDPLSRANTKILYPADNGQKLAQKIILGIGGVRALQELGIPIDIYHLNEGYSVLAAIELIRQKMAKGSNIVKTWSETVKQIVFTTHTPEMTGSEVYDLNLMMEIGCFPGLTRPQAAFLGGKPSNLTIASLKTAKIANTVSKLHAETANRTWAWVKGKCQIIPITNGIDIPYWQWPGFQGEKTLEEICEVKRKYKRFLLDYIKEETGKSFSEDILTVVWARRWANYKRPWLLYYDHGWFGELLKSNKVQVIYAGLPHPADLPMIGCWNEVWQMNKGFSKLVILPGYDLALSKLLKGGADLWLNTPRRPREACGTSWISAMANCTLVISSRDGGVLEGITPEENGFLFGVDYPCSNEGEQDARDFRGLKECLPLVMDIFYHSKNRWYQMALEAKKKAEKDFSAARMLRDYISQLYSNK